MSISGKYFNGISIEAAASAIGLSLPDWEGNCYAVAVALVREKIVKGKAAYGLYGGPVSSNGFWKDRVSCPIIHHGWIQIEDDKILDPTRWSFEAADPYFFIGSSKRPEYDLCGIKHREENLSPFPLRNKMDQVIKWTLSPKASSAYATISGCRISEVGDITVNQLFWLANVSPTLLGESAKEIYEQFSKIGYAGFIPIDSDNFVRGGRY